MAERGTRANEKSKGTLEPGKLSDLVILENNPLEVPPDTIGEIAVLETIQRGEDDLVPRGEISRARR